MPVLPAPLPPTIKQARLMNRCVFRNIEESHCQQIIRGTRHMNLQKNHYTRGRAEAVNRTTGCRFFSQTKSSSTCVGLQLREDLCLCLHEQDGISFTFLFLNTLQPCLHITPTFWAVVLSKTPGFPCRYLHPLANWCVYLAVPMCPPRYGYAAFGLGGKLREPSNVFWKCSGVMSLEPVPLQS